MSRASRITRSMFCSFWLFAISADSEAQLFDFVGDDSGEVLATLNLSSLPATHEDIVSLTFSPIGESIFGYASTFPGEFQDSTGRFADDGFGGLIGADALENGEAILGGFNPPASSLHPSGTARISLLANDQLSSLDAILVLPLSSDDPQIVSSGNWRLVPEPSSAKLMLTAVTCGFGLRRHRILCRRRTGK